MKKILYYICPQFMLILAVRYLSSQMDLFKEAGSDIQVIATLKRTKFLILLSLVILIASIVFKSFIGLGIYLIFHLILTQHPLLTDIKRLDQCFKTRPSLYPTIREKNDLN